MSDERYERGAEIVARVYKDFGDQFLAEVAATSPDLTRYVREFAFGDIYSRPGLDPRQREMVIIASLATIGYAAHELKAHIHGALNNGVTREEVIEVLIQVTPYAGFPASINGIHAAKEVFAEWDARGKEDLPPPNEHADSTTN
ncbi:4-carboxymuconolactone decarboxylase [Capsulimonas corticalis]|uniref:4-carboxymuconolactone decarboxylase n=1 Tax=Capsulimonas corticalis TaxID=2219043 RepID=A0A402CYN7_9BACT|nr:carboxymuconolactone decarboxylase family protein [Capsulimonas corticalis]BDI31282.1 4-carboxymuconolactone decarboxylase [Capsulimonas corticalis]